MRTSVRVAVAYAVMEWRTARRSVGYWLPIVAAVVVSLLLYLFYAGLYDHGAGYLSIAETLSPRRFLALHGGTILGLFLVALVFVALNEVIPGRHGAINGVLSTKPSSNFWCLAGRVFALVTMAWLPLVATVGLIKALGCRGDPYVWLTCGTGMDIVSFAVFVLVDALPLLLLWSAVLVFLSTVQHSRIGVALSALTILSVLVWALLSMPTYLVALLRPASELREFLSETLPAIPSYGVLVQRVASTALALGTVSLAALLLPRADDDRLANAVAAIGLVIFSAICVSTAVTGAQKDVERRNVWLATHTVVANDFSAAVDIEHITGTIRIAPTEELHIDVDLRLRRVANDPIVELVFSLNPGMVIEELRIGQATATYAHETGVLTVILPEDLHGTSMLTMSIEARGIPDPDFGYLESALDWRRTTGQELAFMGTKSTLFGSDYVALMPAVRWLPTVGPNVVWDDWSQDFLAVDLVVETPPNWLPAGPGYRTTIGEGRHRFRTESPVRDVAIFASAFKRFAIRTTQIEVELLIDAKHLTDIEPFVDAAPLLIERIDDILVDARSLGLHYPYRALSIIAVP